jgi:putative (di)nucleoside polyphosphate hydrolase
VCLDLHNKPEFDDWQWVSFYYPIKQVVDFKQDVYRRALVELAQFLPKALRTTNESATHATAR